MNLFVLSGHGRESFVAFLNEVILQKNAGVITAAVTTAQITRRYFYLNLKVLSRCVVMTAAVIAAAFCL